MSKSLRFSYKGAVRAGTSRLNRAVLDHNYACHITSELGLHSCEWCFRKIVLDRSTLESIHSLTQAVREQASKNENLHEWD